MRRGLIALAACAVPSRRTRLARPRPVNGHSRLRASHGSPRRCRLRRHQRRRVARLAPRPRTRRVIYPDAKGIRGRTVARGIHRDPDVLVSFRDRVHETLKKRSTAELTRLFSHPSMTVPGNTAPRSIPPSPLPRTPRSAPPSPVASSSARCSPSRPNPARLTQSSSPRGHWQASRVRYLSRVPTRARTRRTLRSRNSLTVEFSRRPARSLAPTAWVGHDSEADPVCDTLSLSRDVEDPQTYSGKLRIATGLAVLQVRSRAPPCLEKFPRPATN